MTPRGTKRWLLAALAAAFVVSYFTPHYNRYYLGVAIDCGIAVIMQVKGGKFKYIETVNP